MLDKLKSVEEKFEDINAQLCDPDVVSDMDKYRKLMQDVKHLTPIVEKYREYKKVNSDLEEAKMLLDEGGLDKDFREMVFEQLEESKQQIEVIGEETMTVGDEQQLEAVVTPEDATDATVTWISMDDEVATVDENGKIDLNKYFPPGTKWDANRPLFLFEVNADGTLGNTGHNPSRDGGKPINSCTAHYYSYFTDRAQNGIRSYIYDPTIPQGVKIIYNKVEWREIIYQMAKDHMSNGHKDNFEAVLAENNRDYYPTGQTGYEQYYTDIISFWRDIYDPSYSNGYEKIHVTKNTFNKEKSKYWELVRCAEDTPYADRIWLKKTGVNATNKDKAYDFVNMDAYIWNNKLLLKEKTYYYYLQQCNNSSIFKSGSEYYVKIEDEFTVQEDENGVVNGWSKEVSQYPEMLNFWFDFLDARDGDLDKYCVQNVGIRPKAENDTNVKAIYFRDTPNVIFVDTTKISKGEKDKLISKYGSEQEWLIYIRDNLTDEEKKQYTGNALQTYIESKQALELKLAVDENIRVQREEMPGYTFIRMPTYMENQFSISAQGKSAFDKLDNWLYTYACCTESISISALPVYYLNPNTRIFVKDTNSGIEGEYIVSRISLPLTYNGMMSISATKAVQRLY